ncbi:accessory iron-sulfur cluster assembly protein IscX [Gammaproteobacteria bacterium]
MKWIDTREIAIALNDNYPDIDPRRVRFTDLHNWVVDLPDFTDDHQRGGEKALEAIQTAWIDELD